jgi:hypothetical protein
MFACALIVLLFLPAAFLPVALDSLLPSSELTEMGIQLEMVAPHTG